MKKFKHILCLLLVCLIITGTVYAKKITSQDTIVLCIDPGHGGYDTGAVGTDGTYEKDLSLAYALEIGERISQANKNIEVIYTRTSDDVSWPSNESEDLKARVAYAQEQNADLYLSIHFNSNDDSSVYGYTAYVKDSDTTSKKIYNKISEALEASNWTYDHGISNTNNYSLYVVDQLSIPSMLFEVGFMSNSTELQDLENASYQTMITQAIADAYLEILSDEDSSLA